MQCNHLYTKGEVPSDLVSGCLIGHRTEFNPFRRLSTVVHYSGSVSSKWGPTPVLRTLARACTEHMEGDWIQTALRKPLHRCATSTFHNTHSLRNLFLCCLLLCSNDWCKYSCLSCSLLMWRYFLTSLNPYCSFCFLSHNTQISYISFST